VLAVGSTFLVVTALLYALFMAGIFSALDVASDTSFIRLAVALVAATFGFLHVKEYVTTAGPSLTISAGRKPGIYHRMRTLADPDRSLPVALAGTVVLAAGVSAVETPCTAGLPVVWTNLLQAAGVGWAGAAVLLTLYLLVFLVDELLVFGLAVFTMRATKLQDRHGRALQLVSGTLMLTLAAAMVFAPALLQSVAGTAMVFAGAALVVAVVLGAEEWWRRQHRRAPSGAHSQHPRPVR
jgi:cytochrome c biogenesis protein CcdA